MLIQFFSLTTKKFLNKVVSWIILPNSKIFGFNLGDLAIYGGTKLYPSLSINTHKVKGNYFKKDPNNDNKNKPVIIKLPGNEAYAQDIHGETTQDENLYYMLDHYNNGYELFKENSEYFNKEKLIVYYYNMITEIFKQDGINKDRAIYLDGHSMGGGFAAYVSAMLLKDGYNVHLINDRSFGTIASFPASILPWIFPRFVFSFIEVIGEKITEFIDLNLRPIDAWNMISSKNKRVLHNEKDSIIPSYAQLSGHINRQNGNKEQENILRESEMLIKRDEIIIGLYKDHHDNEGIYVHNQPREKFHLRDKFIGFEKKIVDQEFMESIPKYELNKFPLKDTIAIANNKELEFPEDKSVYKTSIYAKAALYTMGGGLVYLMRNFLPTLKNIITKTTINFAKITPLAVVTTALYGVADYYLNNDSLDWKKSLFNTAVNIATGIMVCSIATFATSLALPYISVYGALAATSVWLGSYFGLEYSANKFNEKFVKFEPHYKTTFRDKFEKPYQEYVKTGKKVGAER